MIGPKNWGMPLKITEKDFSRQASFDRQWDAYKIFGVGGSDGN